MKYVFSILCFILIATSTSCSSEEAYDINLKWNKAYPEDTFERSITGLKWALSYLGSTVANDSTLIKFNTRDSIISLNVKQLGFSEGAAFKLAKLNYIFKNTEAFKTNNSFDLGRYVALTFGNTYHYYEITEASKHIDELKQKYILDSIKGYIDNSSVSKVHRIISFSNLSETNQQAFISAEVDSLTKSIYEFEAIERMPNGQLKFSIYDVTGNLKNVADNEVTKAGKPAKCIWCHEVKVLPIFRPQLNHIGYIKSLKFNDTLKYFNLKLQNYQDSKWKDKNLRNKKLHTELELLYISFMEPTAERISREWQIPLTEARKKLSGLETHIYEEFPFLGNLYHRKDIDVLAPHNVIEVSESIREKSNNEVNLLK